MDKKRGEAGSSLVMYVLFELAIIVMFSAAILMKINAAVTDQTYYQRFIARDVALTVDTMQAAEGNFKLDYAYATSKESNLDIFLLPGFVAISEPAQRNESAEKKIKFLIGFNDMINITNSSSLQTDKLNSISKDDFHSRKFTIEKNNTEIKLSETKSSTTNTAVK